MSAAPFVAGSATSQAAAESIKPGELREAVFAAIEKRGQLGATSDELEDILRMRHQTCSARVRDLVLAGRVVDSGKTRKTRSGRAATVWLAMATGQQGSLF